MAEKAKEAEEAAVFNENAIFWPDIVIFLENRSFLCLFEDGIIEKALDLYWAVSRAASGGAPP